MLLSLSVLLFASRLFTYIAHVVSFIAVAVWAKVEPPVVVSLKSKYKIKHRGRLGNDPAGVQTIDVVGRMVRRHSWGISWDADARHQNIIMGHIGLIDDSRSLV